MAPKPGSLGQPIPGHVGAIVDDAGNELPAGEVGQIAFRRPDPVMLLEYWNNPVATRDKFAGDWLLTGDLGVRDEDGYFWYRSRADDVITSAGYRIGPGEIEEALLRHPAVRLAAAIGVPDAVRTEASRRSWSSPKTNSRPTLWHRRFASSSRRGWRGTSIRATSSSSTACRRRPPARSCGGNCASGNGRRRRQGTSRRRLTGGELLAVAAVRDFEDPTAAPSHVCARLRATIPRRVAHSQATVIAARRWEVRLLFDRAPDRRCG